MLGTRRLPCSSCLGSMIPTIRNQAITRKELHRSLHLLLSRSWPVAACLEILVLFYETAFRGESKARTSFEARRARLITTAVNLRAKCGMSLESQRPLSMANPTFQYAVCSQVSRAGRGFRHTPMAMDWTPPLPTLCNNNSTPMNYEVPADSPPLSAHKASRIHRGPRPTGMGDRLAANPTTYGTRKFTGIHSLLHVSLRYAFTAWLESVAAQTAALQKSLMRYMTAQCP